MADRTQVEKFMRMMSQNNSKKNSLETETAEVKMVKLSTKQTRKYLLIVTVHGFSKALKLGEWTFVTIFFRILLNFVKKYPLLPLHGGLTYLLE